MTFPSDLDPGLSGINLGDLLTGSNPKAAPLLFEQVRVWTGVIQAPVCVSLPVSAELSKRSTKTHGR